MKKANILFIMTDQCRSDVTGIKGDWVKTENLDLLAAEGVSFDNCISNSPVCIPARVSLATGHYPHTTGIWKNVVHDMPAESATWMQCLRNAGYRTSLFGKTHLHQHHGDLRDREYLIKAYGIDDIDEIAGPRASARVMSHMTERWQELGLLESYQDDYAERFSNKPHVVRPSVLPLEEYADTYVGRKAAEYLQNYDLDQPWFCWVSFGGPHEPWDTPEPYASIHKKEDMPAAIPPENMDMVPPERMPENFSKEEIAEMRADYAGNVTLIDEWIGNIFKVIKERGEWDNTIIVFTSDHGELNGDHGLIYKSCFYDGCLKIPLIIRTPDKTGQNNLTCPQPVELMDVGPTICSLAGVEIPYRQFGKDLSPVLDDVNHEIREGALVELHDHTALVTTDWKCVVDSNGKVVQLFNCNEDKQELNNLANAPDMQTIAKELQVRILNRILTTQVIF